jgi:hypothetical protein
MLPGSLIGITICYSNSARHVDRFVTVDGMVIGCVHLQGLWLVCGNVKTQLVRCCVRDQMQVHYTKIYLLMLYLKYISMYTFTLLHLYYLLIYSKPTIL